MIIKELKLRKTLKTYDDIIKNGKKIKYIDDNIRQIIYNHFGYKEKMPVNGEIGLALLQDEMILYDLMQLVKKDIKNYNLNNKELK